jgi:hypothetical protein
MSFLPLSALAKRFQFERDIKTLSKRIMTTYRLLIVIEHALPNWPIVDLRKKHTFSNAQLSPQYWIGFLFVFEIL